MSAQNTQSGSDDRSFPFIILLIHLSCTSIITKKCSINTCTHNNSYGDLPFKMVYFVGVLSTAVSVTQQRIVIKGFILQHLNSLTSTSLILTSLCYTVQLRYLVLVGTQKQSLIQHECRCTPKTMQITEID